MSTPFLGIRDNAKWATNEVPERYEQMILKEFPNGMTPLFALQSAFAEETVDSHTYHWWTKTLPTRSGTVSSIYIDSALDTEYVKATHAATQGIAGKVVYAKVAEATANYFVPGTTCILRDSDQPTVDVMAKVTDVVLNGASSYLACMLLEADDNHATTATYNLATVDYVLRTGTAFGDFSDAPRPLGYTPTEYSNHPQIFRNTFALGNSAMAENLRTDSGYMQDKLDCMQDHNLDIEMSGWFGVQGSGTDEAGKPIYYTDGLFNFMRTNNSSNIMDYRYETAAAYSGKLWTQAGKKWLDAAFSTLFMYLDSGEAMVWCGAGALNGIQELAETYADINIQPRQSVFGIQVTEWVTPHGIVYFKTHPLFSRDTTLTNTMVLGHPKNARFCPKVGNGKNRRTQFQENMQIPGQDGRLDGYLTEGGWKWYFPNQWLVLNGVGLDNA